MRLAFLLLAVSLLGAVTTSRADSPLTSTDFSAAYESEEIVAKATAARGMITEELMAWLDDDANPIDVKVAVINRLGWSIEGQLNANSYWKYLQMVHGYGSEKAFRKKGKAHQLLCYSYLKALDNYFDVTEALDYAKLALKKDPKSYTFRIITALIEAQKAFDDDWCKVYRLTDDVRNDDGLRVDMKEEASQLIFAYMDIYGGYCEGQ